MIVVIFIWVPASQLQLKLYSMKPNKSTERDLFPAWQHVVASSHPHGDVQHRYVRTGWCVPTDLVAYVYQRQGFVILCFQFQTSFLESRLEVNCAPSQATQGFVWTGWELVPDRKLLADFSTLLVGYQRTTPGWDKHSSCWKIRGGCSWKSQMKCN